MTDIRITKETRNILTKYSAILEILSLNFFKNKNLKYFRQ